MSTHTMINQLEHQIEDLIYACKVLQQENNELRQKNAELMQSHLYTTEQNQLNAEHIRQVVQKIKAVTG